ncbi:hypothetical protein HY479_04130 [Candidatus Uhrbacteria bacterium]|nr:hypothetical protein [Candidatus Uhrbacteria bacterium]
MKKENDPLPTETLSSQAGAVAHGVQPPRSHPGFDEDLVDPRGEFGEEARLNRALLEASVESERSRKISGKTPFTGS